MADILCIGGYFHGKIKEINDELLHSKTIVVFVDYNTLLSDHENCNSFSTAVYEYEVLLIISPSGTKHYTCVYTGEEDENETNSERNIS